MNWKIILRWVFDLCTLGISIYLRKQKEIKCLIQCIEAEKKTASILIEEIKNNRMTVANIEDFLSPKKINNRLKILQLAAGMRSEIKSDVIKYVDVKVIEDPKLLGS